MLRSGSQPCLQQLTIQVRCCPPSSSVHCEPSRRLHHQFNKCW